LKNRGVPGAAIAVDVTDVAVEPDLSVRVPVDGVAAKLSMPSRPATEQRVKANKTRGLKRPDWKMLFFFMGFASCFRVEFVSCEVKIRNQMYVRMCLARRNPIELKDRRLV